MPKYVGKWIEGAVLVDAPPKGAVQLRQRQAALLPPSSVYAVLDTSDRGGPGRMAKRWHRWYALPLDVRSCAHATENMLRRARGTAKERRVPQGV